MQLSHNNNKVLPTECEILQLTVNRKLIFGMKRSIKQPRKDVGRSQTVTTPTQASKSSQKMSRQRPMWTKPTQRRDWSDVTGPPRGDPTLHLTFISSQITWVWLSLGFAQRGALRVLDDNADMHCWRVTGFWRGPRASSRLRQVLPYTMSDMRTDGLHSKTHSHLQGFMCTKRLIWESAQGPLEPAALLALCTEWHVAVLQKPTGIYIF